MIVIEEGELHPAMILDWNNSIANNLNSSEDDIWILKYENGNLLKMETENCNTGWHERIGVLWKRIP